MVSWLQQANGSRGLTRQKKPTSLLSGKTIALVHMLLLVTAISEAHETKMLSCWLVLYVQMLDRSKQDLFTIL